MKKILFLNKKEGETPLQALEYFRVKHKKYQDVKMTYAGRLDPMASGLLLVLAGDETKNKEKYLSFDKEYEFEILFGFATDTYDILGKIIRRDTMLWSPRSVGLSSLAKKVRTNLKFFRGKFIQKYPIYSSKTVAGRQLFEYARQGLDVDIPEREVSVQKLRFLKLRTISNKKLLENIKKRIKKVKGDFRQKKILKMWKKELLLRESNKFLIGSFVIKCGSGTYVRGIVNSLGDKIKIPALAFSIKRTKISKWSKPGSRSSLLLGSLPGKM